MVRSPDLWIPVALTKSLAAISKNWGPPHLEDPIKKFDIDAHSVTLKEECLGIRLGLRKCVFSRPRRLWEVG